MRIFVEPGELRAGELAIRGDEHHYVSRVRRARVGEHVELVDRAGRRAAAQIVRMADDATTVVASEPEAIAPARPRVIAMIPWIKGDRMEQCIEKLVEVGCDEVVIWPAARAVVQLAGARRDARIAKLAAVAAAAARQCGRADIMAVRAVDRLADAIAEVAAGTRKLALVPGGEPLAIGAVGAADIGEMEVAIASGPEGGLAPGEIDQLLAADFADVGLGVRVLRAETAPVVAVAAIRLATRS